MTSSQDIEQNQPTLPNSNEPNNQSDLSLNALDVIRDEPQLRRAFEQFSEQSMRLEESYNTLEAQFRQVSAQLHQVYCQLDLKINELATAKRCQEILLSKMWQGVLFIAGDQKILTCNQAMSKWLGQSDQELLNANFEEKFRDDLFGFSIKQALKIGKGPQKCFAPSQGQKDLPPLEITTSFITFLDNSEGGEENSSQEGLCIIARDLTQGYQARLGLLSNRSELKIKSVSMDLIKRLRPALQSIQSSAQSLDDVQMSAKDELGKQGLFASELLSAFSTYIEPIQVELGNVELKSMIEEIIQHFKDPKMSFEDLKLPLAFADHALLQTALKDLIESVKAIAEKDHATVIKGQSDEEQVIIQLHFEALCITDEDLTASFLPFDPATEKAELQLWHIDKKIEAMSGRFEVCSKSENSIAFSISLPISPDAQTALEP